MRPAGRFLFEESHIGIGIPTLELKRQVDADDSAADDQEIGATWQRGGGSYPTIRERPVVRELRCRSRTPERGLQTAASVGACVRPFRRPSSA